MADIVILVLAVVLIAQIPISIIVHIDAKRLGLETPVMYELGIIVPLGGFLVFPWYVLNRSDLPRREPDDE